MEDFQVKDKSLAAQGHLQIEWASKHMPVLNIIKERFEKKNHYKDKPWQHAYTLQKKRQF